MKKTFFVFSIVTALFFTACDPNAIEDFLNDAEKGDSIQLDGDSIQFPGFDGDSIQFPEFDGDSIEFPWFDDDSIEFPEFDDDSIVIPGIDFDSIPLFPGFGNDSIKKSKRLL